jgi:hypothetical protein
MSEVEEGIKKFKAKLDHVRLRLIMSDVIPETIDKAKNAINVNAALNAKVKVILDKYNVAPDFRPYYYAYARALDKTQRVFPYMVDRIREHQILRSRFEGRGLSGDILDVLDQLLIWNKSNP